MKLLLFAMLVIYVVSCFVLIYVVLRQEGKGGGISGMMGGGSALGDTLGAQGGEQFYRKWTRNFAIIFLTFSILITLVKRYEVSGGASVLDQMPSQSPTAPAANPVVPGADVIPLPDGPPAPVASEAGVILPTEAVALPAEAVTLPAEAETAPAEAAPAEAEPATADEESPAAAPDEAAETAPAEADEAADPATGANPE